MTQLSPEARRLMQLARNEDNPSPEALRRVERSLALGTARAAGVVALGAATAHAATATTLGTLKWVSVAVLVGGASAAGVVAASHSPSVEVQRLRAGAPAREPLTRRSERPMSSLPAAPAPVVSQVPEVLPETEMLLAAAAAPRALAPAAPPTRPTMKPLDRLQDETRELRQAQQALRSGDAARALVLLTEQDQTFEHGALQQERHAARVLTLCQLGQTVRAKAEAESFERRYPKSALLARVRSSCF